VPMGFISRFSNFFSAINLTRAKAIERGGRVYMRPADGTNWAAGWVIFVNPAGDANKLYTATDTLISSHDAVPVGITISTAFSVSATGIGEYIAYDGTGRPVNEAAAGAPVSNRFGNVTFLQDGKARCIFVNLLGRPRVYKSLTTTCTATS
ncbi:MAG: GspH/FimT family protein, partial [Pseudomonadota bacterium]